jgi:hypothetical protein
MKNRILIITSLLFLLVCLNSCKKDDAADDAVVTSFIDHTNTDLSKIPDEWINMAKENLHIAYAHTSHGHQITIGMNVLESRLGAKYAWNDGPLAGSLDMDDNFVDGDLGNPDRTTWEQRTREYLALNADVNVVIWSWCGEVSDATEANINTYLNLMNGLETDFPNVKFVYMTGHLDGTGEAGILHLRNEQIRKYCKDNNKYLYDFNDIESYDPDGKYYRDKLANDECNYDSDGNGSRDKNWAIDWQNAHTEGVDWYTSNPYPDHTQPINGNMKAYAAWYLWARLAGWDGK